LKRDPDAQTELAAEQPKYRKVGSLDYSDTIGTLTPVLSCQGCGALVVETEVHDWWHSTYCAYVGSNRRVRLNDGRDDDQSAV
jgi:hypothetical protein